MAAGLGGDSQRARVGASDPGCARRPEGPTADIRPRRLLRREASRLLRGRWLPRRTARRTTGRKRPLLPPLRRLPDAGGAAPAVRRPDAGDCSAPLRLRVLLYAAV